ncbi:MAG: aspartate aminotransferase family protein [Geminicoccaceae bacterium]
MTTKAGRTAPIENALRDVHQRFRARFPASASQFEDACQALPGGNTRTVLFYTPFPLTFISGEGAYLTDLDGHRLIDFVSEQTAALYGHSHPAIITAIQGALSSGLTLGGPNRYEAELAELLCARFPSIDLVRFCNSGTEANLLALATARAVTGRPRILVFEGGYHGSLLQFSTPPSPINAPFDQAVLPYNDTAQAVELIEREGESFAAILVEPMMGAAGCIPAAPEFLAGLREASDRRGVILIFDEVMTSRLSASGLQGSIGVTPDLTTLGKYVGGGLSFGAFGGRRDIMERFDPRRPDRFNHPGTFNNNTLSMAAGLAGLRDVYTESEATAFNARGDKLRVRLNQIFLDRMLPAQVTGVGSLMNLHFTDTRIEQAADARRSDSRLRELVHLELLLNGLFTARRGFIALSLPLTTSEFDRLTAALAALADQWSPLLGSDDKK